MTTIRRLAPQRPTAATYWRRRFVALAVGLSVLALVTWAASSLLGGLAAGGPSAGSAGSGGQHHGKAGSGPAAVDSAPRPCAAGDVVLSLFSSEVSYTARQTPEFQLDVVSTASQTCTFDIGASHVWLQINAGKLRVWTSADCAEGEASLVMDLHRGVPTVVTIDWNDQVSSPGCPVPGAAAGSGSYTAVAYDGSTSSNALDFRIG